MKKAEAAELLQLLIEQAPKLRDAGVAKVQLDGFAFELRPKEPEPDSTSDGEPVADQPIDPFHDEATFGGRRIPGKQRRGENT